MMDEATISNCGAISSTGEDEGNVAHLTASEDNKSLAPYVGMEFQSHEEAQKFYRLYAKSVGFGTKVHNSHCRVIGGKRQLWYITFACEREGFKREMQHVENPRPNCRVGCKAEMRIKRKGRNDCMWICYFVATEHNHDVGPLLPDLIRAKRISDQRKIARAHKTMIQRSKVKQLSIETEGMDKLNDRRKEVKNFIDGDVNAIQKLFAERSSKNPSLFYQMEVNKEGHLNVFWVDGRCRASYNYFGDVITFDTTYLTNKYNMPLALFVGVNHHGQSVLLGCGLLANEATETFTWLFQTWLKAMGWPPISIITDQSPSIQAAVKMVFPEIRYRLCPSHIMKRRNEMFSGMLNKREVMSVMSKCVYDSFKVEDFVRDWNDMIKKYSLEKNEWLQSLYEVRELWVPTYLKGTFFAGMQTTYRSEGVDHYFDGYVHQKSTLSEFLEQHDRALQDHYQKEIEADFADVHSNPILRINHCFEVQGASFYTREIFQKFQSEVLCIGNCVITIKDVDGAITTYAVKDMITKENGVVERKEYEVTFDALEIKVSCICCMFEFQGILCNHALSVLYAVEVTQIPSRYMLQRWRKDFKRIHALNGDREQAQVNNAVDRFNDLWHRFIQFADEAATTTERYLFAVQALSEATNKLRHMGGCPNIDLRASASPNLISERSPQISTFGNTCKASESNEMNCMSKILDLELEAEGGPLKTKRFKPHLETLRGKTRAKNCSICKRPGHTRVTCEENQVKSVQSTQLEQDDIEESLQLMGEVNFGSKNLQPVTFNYHF
eukprot:TRINITY_DN704_c2_g1_i1.p1 TRINITY_DN704_c2_g1~~TRINITY_DN704_c2_g1_i1.p1  ORF type:complete len:781 (+),score=116.72 TRINITY_DN704_c2_g1_i1:322-2664(+)